MFYFGADYYPEHWPEERWPEDARLMAEAGFNVVRLAEFAWSRLEPEHGRYEFAWLDRVLEVLAEAGIQTVLGTPTASPPPWLMVKYPEAFLVRSDGLRKTYGNRREYCPNHPAYQAASRRIVNQMAQHYAGHPNIIGWQIDNEFGDRCYCPVCTNGFREWLSRRYPSLQDLNAKWGTIFWSHVYNDWSEIPVPLATGGSPNPGLALDYYRYQSDAYVAYQQMQVDILRDKCPGQFITHNFMGYGYENLDYYDLARGLDMVSWDNYPRGFWSSPIEVDPSGMALSHDTMRGLKGLNFWVMEQQAGSSGWEIVSAAPRPGELRLWAYQAIAHGADGIVFFRWRTARFGTEQYWHGLLDHDGTPGRRYLEIKQMGLELNKIGAEIAGAEVRPAVAIIQSYDTRFAFQVQANNSGFHYGEHLQQVYRALYRCRLPVNVVGPGADLSKYVLVVVPAMYVLEEEVAASLREYVMAGGTIVITPRTGVKDVSNMVVNLPLPGLMADVCGMRVTEYDSLPTDIRQPLEFVLSELAGAPVAETRAWCDILQPETAEVVARYTQDYYAGKPAITLNRYGEGRAIYVGTFGDTPLYEGLFTWLMGLTNEQRTIAAPQGVEIAERWQGDKRIVFVLNHTTTPQEVVLGTEYRHLFEPAHICQGKTSLAPREVLVLEELT